MNIVCLTILTTFDNNSWNYKTCFLGLLIPNVIMADSVYISANLTSTQLEFMKLLDDYEIDIFTFERIEEQIDRKFDNLNEVLENLVHKELLSRIERGKFCKVNFRDQYVIGAFVVKEGAIGYWTALNLHGLTEQFSNTVFVQTTHKKNDKEIFGTSYKFVKISESKRAGIVKEGYGNHTYPITDLEKTIIDCFDLPQYSGGYEELIRAFATAEMSADKLISYCKAINNLAVTKRIGYLAELLEKKGLKSFVRFAKKQIKDAYNLLDPSGSEKGVYDPNWKLVLNIPEEALLDITNKQY